MFATSIYSWTLLLHVVAAMLLIGSAIVGFHITQALMDATSTSVMQTLIDVLERAAKVGPPAALTVLATGLYLGSHGWWTRPWFYVAIGLWILQAWLSASVVRANARSLAATLRSSDAHVPDEADAIRASRSWLAGGAVMHGNDFAMLYLMFNKPPLLESLLAVVLAQVACVFAETALRRRRLGGVTVRSAAA